ncbi:aminotransferase class I/II-fold pyridoxal phosphate-dependent enzyme [Roseisolibacter sp. H3M3-2]|uniref:aminotransferase class I/II-fold pyridoxal phosphate-dependent enzyme n=1 Tax=Roseisolibacter sp. H3M3-2 TaxID=3031323 RepID=UPI0023DC4B27|nr:aminotransferase class I/II-fold pyridoxal phosphate-dependent enzyme [Roseisolibacter sp. H3M3-2]MDF1502025.1 aminotransferase class I/II-fold pyridoxal phosphate-dependent enzyme [Roseisolibacter sp. H3M3-2]
MPRPAQRFQALPPYPLAHVPVRKRELLQQGVDVIDLGAGDADLPPPPAAVAAMTRALAELAMHRYGFGLGHVPFREAVSAWMQRRFGLSFDPITEICPLIGSKEGITHLALAFLEKGDVAVIPEPGYLAYVGGTLLGEATPYPVALRPEKRFLVELDEIPDDVLRRTKLLYLNYPNNPTAAVAPRDYLERVVRTCRERDIVLVYDNAYSELAYDGYVPPSIFEIAGAREVALEFHSLSKTYNMTGWRQGWAVGNPQLVGALARVKSFVDTGSFMAIQAAGVAALESWAEFVPGNVAIFRERRDAAVAAFRDAGFACDVPRAAMYLWVALPEGVPSRAFCDRLMDEEGVITLAGSSFGPGGEGFFRISFIATPQRIAEAARRAGKVLAAMAAPV